MKLSELPENYRKAENFQDFCIGDIVYRKNCHSEGFMLGHVTDLTTYVGIKWSTYSYPVGYTSDEITAIYVLDKEKEPKHNFKVNDRVTWPAYNDLIGTITHITDTHIDVLWRSNEQRLSKGTYSKEYWSELKPIQEPKVTKEITLDLELHFNLDTTGIETVLVDCVKALVSNGKYQEAKELCELLVSVRDLGKAQENTEDDTAEGA